MYGEHRQLITKTYVTCQKVVAMRVDPEDVQRHGDGTLVQDAFADRGGKPYLEPELRELWVSGVCGACWKLLCPDPLVSRHEYN